MAEAVLVRPELTPQMVEAGRALLARLDGEGRAFDAAFWLLRYDSIKWHLVLSHRGVHKDGSLKLYREVNKAVHKLQLQDVIWVGDISIKDDQEPIIESLRKALGTTASADGTRLDNATVGGEQIAGCVLYRLTLRQKQTPIASGAGRRRARSVAPA